MCDQGKEEEMMILKIVEICQKHSKFNLDFLTKPFAGVMGFKQFLEHLVIKIEL